jgi:DNA segregation ATPase FtsK/SpoIIIE-like protein
VVLSADATTVAPLPAAGDLQGVFVMGLPVPIGRQRDVVYLTSRGHLVVLGTAGTGKTVMAVHREGDC